METTKHVPVSTTSIPKKKLLTVFIIELIVFGIAISDFYTDIKVAISYKEGINCTSVQSVCPISSLNKYSTPLFIISSIGFAISLSSFVVSLIYIKTEETRNKYNYNLKPIAIMIEDFGSLVIMMSIIPEVAGVTQLWLISAIISCVSITFTWIKWCYSVSKNYKSVCGLYRFFIWLCCGSASFVLVFVAIICLVWLGVLGDGYYMIAVDNDCIGYISHVEGDGWHDNDLQISCDTGFNNMTDFRCKDWSCNSDGIEHNGNVGDCWNSCGRLVCFEHCLLK